MFAQVAPRFLYPEKKIPRYVYSDWLASQFGIESEGAFGALNFGLPMEGMVTIGMVGIFIYPFVEVFTLLCAANYISLRHAGRAYDRNAI
jgi:uncharacterized protein YqgC (DUF456 family)